MASAAAGADRAARHTYTSVRSNDDDIFVAVARARSRAHARLDFCRCRGFLDVRCCEPHRSPRHRLHPARPSGPPVRLKQNFPPRCGATLSSPTPPPTWSLTCTRRTRNQSALQHRRDHRDRRTWIHRPTPMGLSAAHPHSNPIQPTALNVRFAQQFDARVLLDEEKPRRAKIDLSKPGDCCTFESAARVVPPSSHPPARALVLPGPGKPGAPVVSCARLVLKCRVVPQ